MIVNSGGRGDRGRANLSAGATSAGSSTDISVPSESKRRSALFVHSNGPTGDDGPHSNRRSKSRLDRVSF